MYKMRHHTKPSNTCRRCRTCCSSSAIVSLAFFFLKPSAGVISEASPSQPHIYTDRALANGLLQGSIRNIQSQSNAHRGHTFLAKSTSVRFLHLKAAFVLCFFFLLLFFNEGKGTLGKTAAKSGRMCGR
ncbi:unnamed protein product [Ixodes pacificus]